MIVLELMLVLPGAVILLVALRMFSPGRRELSAAKQAQLRRDFRSVSEFCEEGVAKSPKTMELYVMGATAYLQYSEPKKALALCDRALKVNGNNDLVWNARANAQMQLGNFRAAMHDSLHGAGIVKRRWMLWDNRPLMTVRTYAAACIWNSHYDRALAEARYLEERGERDVAAYIRCYAYHNMNDEASALGECDLGLKNLKDATLKYQLLNMRACILINMGRYDEALKQFGDAISLYPHFGMLLINRAYCYTRMGDLPLAIQDLAAAEKKQLFNTDKAFLLSNKARICILQNDPAAAHAIVAEAVEIYPSPSIRCTMGATLLKEGKHREALDELNKAIEMDEYESEAYWIRHEVFQALGDQKRAAADKALAEKYNYAPYL